MLIALQRPGVLALVVFLACDVFAASMFHQMVVRIRTKLFPAKSLNRVKETRRYIRLSQVVLLPIGVAVTFGVLTSRDVIALASYVGWYIVYIGLVPYLLLVSAARSE